MFQRDAPQKNANSVSLETDTAENNSGLCRCVILTHDDLPMKDKRLPSTAESDNDGCSVVSQPAGSLAEEKG